MAPPAPAAVGPALERRSVLLLRLYVVVAVAGTGWALVGELGRR
jgi:hypothetical protein